MLDDEDIAAQQELLDTYRRNLRLLLLQVAQRGGTSAAPVGVLNDIRDTRKNIQRIKTILRDNEIVVADHPDDVAPSFESPPQESEPAEQQSDIPAPKRHVQIYVHGPFSAERTSAALIAMAAILEIPPQLIELNRVYPGSIVFELRVPVTAAHRLHTLLQTNDSRLLKADIYKVIGETESGGVEEWSLRNGTLALVSASPLGQLDWIHRSRYFGIQGPLAWAITIGIDALFAVLYVVNVWLVNTYLIEPLKAAGADRWQLRDFHGLFTFLAGVPIIWYFVKDILMIRLRILGRDRNTTVSTASGVSNSQTTTTANVKTGDKKPDKRRRFIERCQWMVYRIRVELNQGRLPIERPLSEAIRIYSIRVLFVVLFLAAQLGLLSLLSNVTIYYLVPLAVAAFGFPIAIFAFSISTAFFEDLHHIRDDLVERIKKRQWKIVKRGRGSKGLRGRDGNIRYDNSREKTGFRFLDFGVASLFIVGIGVLLMVISLNAPASSALTGSAGLPSRLIELPKSQGSSKDIEISRIFYTRDSSHLVIASRQGVQLYDIQKGTFVPNKKITTTAEEVALSPDEEIVAAASSGRDIQLWRFQGGSLLHTLTGHTAAIKSIAFSPDGQLLASGGDDDQVLIWRVADGALLHTLRGHTDVVTSVIFSSNGMLLASGSGDETVRLWRVSDGILVRTLGKARAVAPTPEPEPGVFTLDVSFTPDGVKTVAFSPDGTILAAGLNYGTIKQWRVSDGALTSSFKYISLLKKCDCQDLSNLAFSPDGTMLAAGVNEDVIVWQIPDGTQRYVLSQHSQPVTTIAFAPDGGSLASGSKDNTIRIWQLR
jgi:WD40 repeat protein